MNATRQLRFEEIKKRGTKYTVKHVAKSLPIKMHTNLKDVVPFSSLCPIEFPIITE